MSAADCTIVADGPSPTRSVPRGVAPADGRSGRQLRGKAVSDPTHLAVDLALSTTGIAWGPGALMHDTIHCPRTLRGGERLSWWRRRIREHLTNAKRPRITTLVVEAPFMSRSHPTGAVPLLKLHGAIEHQAHTAGVGFVEVENHILKKWATGKGNADKDAMVAAARDRGFDGADHNAADAWLLWRFWQERQQ